jgi:hypothetical protein
MNDAAVYLRKERYVRWTFLWKSSCDASFISRSSEHKCLMPCTRRYQISSWILIELNGTGLKRCNLCCHGLELHVVGRRRVLPGGAFLCSFLVVLLLLIVVILVVLFFLLIVFFLVVIIVVLATGLPPRGSHGAAVVVVTNGIAMECSRLVQLVPVADLQSKTR